MNRAALLATILGLALAVAGPPAVVAQAAGKDSCVACHEVLPDSRLSAPAASFPRDIHAAKGFGCVACHGGDASIESLAAMDRAKGFVGKPSGQQIPRLCARCHADAEFMKRYNPALRVDQEAEYATSVHGRRLAQFNDSRVATCASCHPAHAIRPPSDPQSSVYPLTVAKTCGACHADTTRMAPYGIPTDQLSKYETSVHWQALSVRRDLSAPTCNDCHGNHGAAPPGISWVGNTCGQCHSVMAAAFAKSRHGQAFPLLGVPGCVACHSNHDIQATGDTMLGLGEGAVCATCHEAGTKPGDAAQAMRQVIDSLRTELDSARRVLRIAEQSGVEVSQAQFDLEGAHSALVSSRAAVHSFDLQAVATEVVAGRKITEQAFVRGERALRELRFRRGGLAVSVLIILVLVVSLLLKIRQLERRPEHPRVAP